MTGAEPMTLVSVEPEVAQMRCSVSYAALGRLLGVPVAPLGPGRGLDLGLAAEGGDCRMCAPDCLPAIGRHHGVPTIRTLRGYGFRLDHPTSSRTSRAGGR